MFEVLRFHVYCFLLKKYLSENSFIKKQNLIEDLEILRSGFVPIKYL